MIRALIIGAAVGAVIAAISWAVGFKLHCAPRTIHQTVYSCWYERT